MKSPKLRTVLIGFGNVGAGYARDETMARHYRYSTHAQVLEAHPRYSWEAVVDPSLEARTCACDEWGVGLIAEELNEVIVACAPDVAVIACPPGDRLPVLKALPSLRAVLVEKPLGFTAREAEAFLRECVRRDVLVQVNFWRRADETFRGLAHGRLTEIVGETQCVFGVYGGGLLNNGSHMIDFARMLFGEIESVRAVGEATVDKNSPLKGDTRVAYVLHSASGASVTMQALDTRCYRENGLDVWGKAGRLTILQEGLAIRAYPVRPNRGMQKESEVASDEPVEIRSTVGEAFYHLYTNLASTLDGSDSLWSDGVSALRTQRVIEAIERSAESGGALVSLLRNEHDGNTT